MTLSGISIWQCCQKSYVKVEGGGGGEYGKNIEEGDGHIGEVVYRWWDTRMHIIMF